MDLPYYSLNKYLKSLYGERVYKISIDGGFTCPNRDGKKGYGGCAFCNEKGSGEHTLNGDIPTQVLRGIEFSKEKGKGNKYIAYFQNFSSTYADIETLKTRYESALINDDVVGLAVATRPDCIDEEVAKTIRSVAFDRTVWVEIGLQTANERTANGFNRCYNNDEFTKAVEILNKYDIPVVVHIIIGLMDESFDDVKATVDFINKHKISGIKIHSLFVLKNTPFAKIYESGKYTPITREYYIECVSYVLSHISPSVVVHRLTGDGEKSEILAPEWTKQKKINLNSITKFMKTNNLTQGCLFKGDYYD